MVPCVCDWFNQNAVVLWTMHPWERDARLIKEALKKGPSAYGVLIEVACTRSSEDLLGARKAYHSLFDHSIEEDVASHIHGIERKVRCPCTILWEELLYDSGSLNVHVCDIYSQIYLSFFFNNSKEHENVSHRDWLKL